MMRSAERGAALLEVLVALAILALAGVAALELTGAGLRVQHVLAERERELALADRLMVTYSLLTRVELDQRIGRQQIGEFEVRVQRPEPDLFRVTVASIEAPDAELLVTVVHRAVQP